MPISEVMKDGSIYKKYEPLFGSWFITEKIGEGAIAQVYAMERNELGITYHSALKAITIPENDDELKSVMADGMTGADLTHYYETIIQNVVNELDVMSRLKGHSHIVSYEDHMIVEHEGEIGWDILIRIELLTPLVEHSLEHPLQEDDVLQLGIDICKALEYCRSFDILHRDVKPENIFIAPGGGYKLGDFGIARIVEETRVGLSRKGTYTYMAPEVYRGGIYGPTADIYSLGMVMYKFLNDGRNIFMPSYPQRVEVDDYDTAFAKRISGASMQEPAHGCPELRSMIMKACAYDPNQRYHDAAEFRQDLEQLQFRQRWENRDAAEPSGTNTDQPLHGGLEKSSEISAEDQNKQSGRKNRIMKVALIAAVVLFLIAAVVDAVIPDNVTDITGIDDGEEIYIGEKLTPTYTVEPKWFREEPITFQITDDAIASVNEQGTITANKVGETTLELTAKDYTRKVDIDVIPKVTKIKGADDKLRIEEGDSQKLDITLKPKKFADEPITYTSGDKDILTVSKKGKITAKNPGKTTVKISAGGCTKKVAVEVYEYVPPAVTYTYRSSGSSGSSKSSGSKSSGSSKSKKSSGGYFKSKDDEYF